MKTRDNDISTFLHWLNIALWMDHPQDLTSPSVRKKDSLICMWNRLSVMWTNRMIFRHFCILFRSLKN